MSASINEKSVEQNTPVNIDPIRWFVRCATGGFIIGSQIEDEDGKPLTKAKAERIAWKHNVKYRNRAEREGRKTCYEFWAASVGGEA